MYEAHFGLADLPFRIAPDPRFYVDATPHRVVIRALLERLGRGEDFTPLIGDFGSGKTTVARRMLEEAEPARHVIAELPHMRVEGDELLDRVAEALGMRRPKAAPPMGSLIPQFEALARDGRDALLLVDEAESLSIGALNRLRKLTSVRVEGRASLHVFLVGRSTPAGIEELERIGRPLNIGAPVRMEPLDAIGTHEYILERLRRAGWTGRPAFDARTTAEIHARCHGTPGRINRLCGRILLHLYMQGRHDIDAEVVRAVDELLQSELIGESAALAQPPLAPASPDADTFPIALSTEAADLDLDIEVPGPSPSTAVVPAQRLPDTRLVVQASAATRGSRGGWLQRRGLVQGVAAVVLLVCGGVLWQTISRVATAYSEHSRFEAAAAAFSRQALAAPAHAAAPLRRALPSPAASAPQTVSATLPKSPVPDTADILAVAEQAVAQAPPGAGQSPSAAVVPASLRDSERAAGAAGPDARARRALTVHRGQTASTIKGAPRAPAATATCTLDGATLGLCDRSQARQAARFAAPEPRLVQPREPVPENVRMPTPASACEPVRAALALCVEGARAAP